MEYFAKSKNSQGHQETVKEHLQKVADLARQYGQEIGAADAAQLTGQLHDLGKYSEAFQKVLEGTKTGVDHALAGACFLDICYRKSSCCRPIIEAVNGHHDGLVAYDNVRSKFDAIEDGKKISQGNGEKESAIEDLGQLKEASKAFKNDFPHYELPKQLLDPPDTNLESMLYTRMLFSCLVDADYTASAINDDETYLEHAEDCRFEPQDLLQKLYAYREKIKEESDADEKLNRYRDMVFDRCGDMGDEPEGLYTLTAPTSTGKTLALLHFALRHSLKHGKKRIIIVLPFLTLAEQSTKAYKEIIPNLIVDHSLSNLPESARALAARWSAPVIITTSVRFFESLFSNRPTDCRKLHNIANSVVLFDEAQSLPVDLTSSTLRAVNELCHRYHTSMVFSTATQPDFSACSGLTWTPREILPEHKAMFEDLKRVEVDWPIYEETPLETIAAQMADGDSVCAIVNLRRHARQLAVALSGQCPEDTVFYITTDLCPAHRSRQIDLIRQRLKQNLPCRVVATQCLEAGVDLDFKMFYRALAPLDAIIQAAGRCNRHGHDALGRVVVFKPQDSRMPYPDKLYKNAAEIVQEMRPPFEINDTEKIREYYRRLFKDVSDKPELKREINSRSFEGTAKEYKLIANAGAQVIVPYAGEQDLYRSVVEELREVGGVTRELLWQALPITVTCFAKNLAKYAEEIHFAHRHDGKYYVSAEGSNVYLLRPQYAELYSAQLGLHFPQEERSDNIF